MHANFPSRQTNININFWVGEWGGSSLIFWAGMSNVTQEPLAFTSPCSAAILLPWLFCTMCAAKANEKSATLHVATTACFNSL